MSERPAAFGASAPPKTIEHNGKVYTIAPVLTHGTMLRVEAAMYERAKRALAELRAELGAEEYLKRLDELRQRFEKGHYAFESEHTLEMLQTTRGALILLSCMMSADEGEILTLLTARAGEMEGVLNEALEASFPPERVRAPGPDGPAPASEPVRPSGDQHPKAQAPSWKGAQHKRGRR